MTSNKSSSRVKYVVIIGYVLVVAILISGLVSIYHNLVDFSEKKIRNEDLSELLIVGNTISKLYEIESAQNLLNAENAEGYFHKCDSILPEVKLNLDSLKLLSVDTARAVKLDTIELLLHQKNENLREIVVLLDSIEKAPGITRETVSSYVPRKLNTEISDYLKDRNLLLPEEVQSDTTVVFGERRGFFSRLRDVFVAPTDSTVMIERQSLMSREELAMVVDTIVNMVRYSERLDLESRKKFQYALFDRQTVMSATNSMLTARIDELLKGIEQEELQKSIQLLEDKNRAISGSQRTMYIVSWLALLIAAIFGLMFLIDVNRSQRYRRQLETSNKRIGELLGMREKLMLTISHDIKAPMSSIMGYIELMNADIDHKKKNVYLRNMKNSGEHVLQLVHNLLDYEKLDSGTWLLKEANFNVHHLVKETIGSFEPLAANKDLIYRIDNRLPEDLVSFGDPYVFRQIMSNLISNAIKYTTEGTVEVRVSLTEKDSTPRLTFSVKDTGAGIGEKDRQTIFQEFHQLKSDDPDNRIEGSGLGLAITKRFVDELEGSIRVDSEKGKGSEFTVDLPLNPAQHVETSGEIVGEKEECNIENLSVLLVDDDPVQLTMTLEMLQLKNVNVVKEINPEKVLDILRKKMFDIIFIDIQMPKTDGFALIRNIRTAGIDHVKTVPIIALSAKSGLSGSDIQAAGFTGFLTKPFTSDSLYATVYRYVKGENLPVAVETVDESVPKGIGALIEFVKEDKAASSEILNAFIAETTLNIEQLKNAFKEKDLQTVGMLAHKMLPLFRMTGDKELISLLQRLEQKESGSSDEEKTVSVSIKRYLSEAKELKSGMGEH